MSREVLIEEFMSLTQRMIKAPKVCQPPEPSRGENACLVLLQLRGGEALPGELAREMQVTTARIAAILKQLEGKGYITRDVRKEDRRHVKVALTKTGLEAAAREVQGVCRKWEQLIDLLGEEDAEAFARILGKIVRKAEEMEEEDVEIQC